MGIFEQLFGQDELASGEPLEPVDVSAAEYSRLLMRDRRGLDAEQRRQDQEDGRRFRQVMQSRYQQVGRSRQAELLEQFSRAQQAHEDAAELAQHKGDEVRRDIDALKTYRKSKQQLWLEHAEELSRELGKRQAIRIKESAGQTRQTKHAAAARLKRDLTERDQQRQEERKHELEDARKLKMQIDEATSTHAIQECKDHFYNQRKAAHDQAVQGQRAGRQERQNEKKEYSEKAAAAKAAALEVKNAAKSAQEALRVKRAAAAKEMREKVRGVGGHTELRDNRKASHRVSKQSVHDDVRSGKFVSVTPDMILSHRHRSRRGARPGLGNSHSGSTPPSARSVTSSRTTPRVY